MHIEAQPFFLFNWSIFPELFPVGIHLKSKLLEADVMVFLQDGVDALPVS